MVAASYLVHYDALSQNATNIITKCDNYLLENVTVLLQKASILLQNATVITIMSVTPGVEKPQMFWILYPKLETTK